MISSITVLLSRGAVVSTIVVLTVLPSMFIVLDRVICATTAGMKDLYKHNSPERRHAAQN